ncbi:MAG: preprotein translocase subunit SecE [Gammaproteobacteria bacterium]|nr:preprotein translocase subunit SecE [Gammaproteobacteria bacterium]
MSEKKAVSKNTKPGFFTRFGRGFVRFFARIGNAFKNMWRELRKVTWPTREMLVNYTTIVVVFMLFMMVVVGLLDAGASKLVNVIMTNFSA